MKTLSIIFLLFVNVCHAQLTGIGVLKLGKPISLIAELEKELGKSVIKCNSIMDQMKYSGKYILELFPSEKESYLTPPFTSYCKGARVFSIGGYSVAGIELKSLYLTFFNDTMIAFNSDYNKEVSDALKLKYGEPKNDLVTKEVKCTYKLTGSDVTYEEITSTDTYNSDPGLLAVGTLKKYYDSKCKETFLNYLVISKSEICRQVKECSDAAKNSLKEKGAEKKKTELKDF